MKSAQCIPFIPLSFYFHNSRVFPPSMFKMMGYLSTSCIFSRYQPLRRQHPSTERIQERCAAHPHSRPLGRCAGDVCIRTARRRTMKRTLKGLAKNPDPWCRSIPGILIKHVEFNESYQDPRKERVCNDLFVFRSFQANKLDYHRENILSRVHGSNRYFCTYLSIKTCTSCLDKNE